jgi:hypothetical protein
MLDTTTGSRRLIFLLGTPRSGTTWLAAILNSYADVVYSHEPLTQLHSPAIDSLIARLKTEGRLSSADRDLLLNEWCQAHHQCRRPPFFRKRFQLAPAWLQMACWTAVRLTGRGSALFRHLFSPALDDLSYDLLVKEIAWSKHVEAIVHSLQPWLVIIVRHPCGVVASLLQGQRLGLMPADDRANWLSHYESISRELGYPPEAVGRMTPCEFLALQWLCENTAYREIAGRYHRSLSIVYERLCRSPRGVCESIFEFLGWEMNRQTERFLDKSTRAQNTGWLAWLQGKHPYFGVIKNPLRSAESWKAKLSEEEKSQILKIARQFPEFEEYFGEAPASRRLASSVTASSRLPADATPAAAGESVPRGLNPETFSLPLLIENPRSAGLQPATVGIPFPLGAVRDADALCLLDPQGKKLPLQRSVTSRWRDGSIRWLLLDFILPPQAGREEPLALTMRAGSNGRAEKQPVVRIERSADGLIVRTDAARFVVTPGDEPLADVSVNGTNILAPGAARFSFTDEHGKSWPLGFERVEVESEGKVRATVRLEGTCRTRPSFRYVLRLCFFAGTGLVRMRFTIHNPHRARHPGNLWDLGDTGSLLFRQLAVELRLAAAGPRRVEWIAEPGQKAAALAGDGPLEIYQDSSGGPNWKSPNHINRHGQVPCSFQGYLLRYDKSQERGLRANPVVALRSDASSLVAAIPEFWQQFPKAIEVEQDLLRLALYPRQFADVHELQGGEQKTHTAWLNFSAQAAAPLSSLEWVHQPACMHAPPDWYADSGAFFTFGPAAQDPADRLESYLAEVIKGSNSLFERRETIDEFGWRNYGDLYADHELAYYQGPQPLISHYNNQYDGLNGALLQFLRSGKEEWFRLADALARHVYDIDIYHTSEDKAAYNGGLFWHTYHYRTAATASHRSFSRAHSHAPGSPFGGGPSNEHNYTTGFLHYYYLTGDPLAREAILSLAHWVLNRDDGRQNVLGLLVDGPAGLASGTTEIRYHGPGRGAGNSVNALLDAWLLTQDRRYLQAAEKLIRRVVHPRDDIPARQLLDVERRWSYTVFLIVLARYLHLKREAGEIDAIYAYAQASLVAYAKWMLANERPYLDRSESLEYPTETWAAQELRKANVLRLAAAHVAKPLASQLVQRGEELAERAWKDLLGFKTRYVTRAAVLVLAEGTRDAALRKQPPEPMPMPAQDFDFGSPERFVPQRIRLLREVKTVPGLARVAIHLLNPRNWWKYYAADPCRADGLKTAEKTGTGTGQLLKT